MQQNKQNKSYSPLLLVTFFLSLIALIAISTLSLWLPDILFNNVVSISDNVLDTQEKVIFDGLTRKIQDLEQRLNEAEKNHEESSSIPTEPLDNTSISPMIEKLNNDYEDIKQLYDQLDRKINSSTSPKIKMTDLQAHLKNHDETYQALSLQVEALNQTMNETLQNEGKFSSYILVIAQFKRASQSNNPFLKEFNQLYNILDDDKKRLELESIRPYAAQGLPLLEKIQADYDQKINALVELNILPSQKQGWMQKLNKAMKSLIRIKPSSADKGSNGITSLLLQAQELMHANYHDAALQKLDALPDATKEELGQTYYLYKARIQLISLLQELNEEMIDKLAQIHFQKAADETRKEAPNNTAEEMPPEPAEASASEKAKEG